MDFLTAVGTGVTSAITYLGNLVSAFTSQSGVLVPIVSLIGLSVGMGVIGWGIRKVKSLIHGY